MNNKYYYSVSKIQYFSRDQMDKIAHYFYIDEIIPSQVYIVEFEALLINKSKELVLIPKTFLLHHQFKYLGEELFRLLEQNSYSDSKNDGSLELLFKYKFIN